MIEIERKFLVLNNDFLNEFKQKHKIVQGYLNSNPNRAVRVRIKDNEAFITVKGIGNETGMSRFEWEKEISIIEAEQLIQLCEPRIIDKIRYLVPFENQLIEVDVFNGENQGLILAEIEINSEKTQIIKPSWLGKEVTNDNRYYNSYLSKNPFKKW